MVSTEVANKLKHKPPQFGAPNIPDVLSDDQVQLYFKKIKALLLEKNKDSHNSNKPPSSDSLKRFDASCKMIFVSIT